MLTHLTKSEKDMVRINVIEEERWTEHYRGLWFQEEEEISPGNGEPSHVKGVDLITLEELVDALKETKSGDAAGPDWMIMELLVRWHTLGLETDAFIKLNIG